MCHDFVLESWVLTGLSDENITAIMTRTVELTTTVMKVLQHTWKLQQLCVFCNSLRIWLKCDGVKAIVLVHTVKAREGVEVQLHLFLTSTLPGGEWTLHKAPNTHWKGDWVDPWASVDTLISCQLSIETQFLSQPAHSLATNRLNCRSSLPLQCTSPVQTSVPNETLTFCKVH